MDVLSDALDTINLSGVIFLRADMAETYGVSMPPPTLSHPTIRPLSDKHRLVMFHVVREGEGWVEVEGHEARELKEGDLILIFDDVYHSVVNAPGATTIPSADVVPSELPAIAPPAARIGPGDVTMRLVCGMLQFVDQGFNPVFSALPPFLHISREDGPDSDWLQMNLSHIIREAEKDELGSNVLLGRLTELLFVETLRSHLRGLPSDEKNWFAALRDPMVGKAIQLIHEDPAHDWSVGELAKRVGSSRSGFSARFTELTGMGCMTYVARWRIRLAGKLLQDGRLSVPEIAERVGYESESAFSRAFKREMGAPPIAWAQSAS